MSVDLSQFHQVFIDEACEHLSSIESLLLALDLDAPSLDDLNAIFRAAHSIKGGAATFGFSDIADLTHALETLLDHLRKEELHPTDAMIEVFLQCCDLLGNLLDLHQKGGEVDQLRLDGLKAELERLAVTGRPVTKQAVPVAAVEPLVAATAIATAARDGWLIQLHPQNNVFAQGASFEAITEDLQALGPVTILQQPDAAGQAGWRLQAGVALAVLQEIFAFICQPEEVTFTPEGGVAAAALPDADEGFGFFMDEAELAAMREEAEGFGFFIDEAELPASQKDEHELPAVQDPPVARDAKNDAPVVAARGAAAPPLGSQPEARAQAQAGKPAALAETSIRVGVEKVDQLINLVGELVITRSMLAQSAAALDPVQYEAIHSGLTNLERNSRDLQETVMSIRMLPINFVFGRFPRVVRDLANKMHKKVVLKLVGEETELDKGLIERLADPLTHLVRNAIDHGIETPQERLAAGKPEQGSITLSASHQGGSILVEVMDDGAGLNRERLLAKAQEKGLPLGENPSDREVWQLIFAAGFSTAQVVTDVSGRGVGMDVVMRNITEMKGQIEIDSSQGFGTRLTLRLPLTLAILDGMSLRVGEEVFILPLTRIIESMQPDSSQLKRLAGKGRVVHIRGEYLPLLPLYKIFSLQPRTTRPEEGILVVVESAAGKLALFVDELLAQQQVVIKSLESHYRKVEGISGATILGDGRVALIIDIEQLARMNQPEAAVI